MEQSNTLEDGFRNYITVKLVQARPMHRNGQDGYEVKYPDGYVSWCPKETWERNAIDIGNSSPVAITPVLNDYDAVIEESTVAAKDYLWRKRRFIRDLFFIAHEGSGEYRKITTESIKADPGYRYMNQLESSVTPWSDTSAVNALRGTHALSVMKAYTDLTATVNLSGNRDFLSFTDAIEDAVQKTAIHLANARVDLDTHLIKNSPGYEQARWLAQKVNTPPTNPEPSVIRLCTIATEYAKLMAVMKEYARIIEAAYRSQFHEAFARSSIITDAIRTAAMNLAQSEESEQKQND